MAVCTSCRKIHPDGFRCSCIVERAETLAAEQHEQRRTQLPGWRRPRPWPHLPERVRQARTASALDLLEALEGAGWRLVTTRADGRHLAVDAVRTPPRGLFPVPNVVA